VFLTEITSPYTFVTFSEHTAIIATLEDPKVTLLNLQEHLHSIEKWLKKWEIKANESKSSHITFSSWKGHCPAVNIKPKYHTSNRNSKIRMTTLRMNVKLERTHRQGGKIMGLKTKEINWLTEKNPIYL